MEKDILASNVSYLSNNKTTFIRVLYLAGPRPTKYLW